MTIQFGREICGDLHASNAREWLVTNGIGGYAAGTVSGVLTRCYHGLLIAALRPPLERTLLLSKLDETVAYGGQTFAIASNRWTSGSVAPEGYRLIESFQLQGGIPRWTYACADALLEKRIWMQPGSNTSYVQYGLLRGSEPAALTIKALVNYRDHNGNSRSNDWQMQVMAEDQGVSVLATPEAVPFYLLASQGDFNPAHDWYLGFDLAQERFRGLVDQEDHLHVATYTVQLAPGETCTLVASTEAQPNLDGQVAIAQRRAYEQTLLKQWNPGVVSPDWIQQLVLAADQFIVDRPLSEDPKGKTVIAGYPWFGDWGRDTMIALPGLTIATGRPELAGKIISTFSRYLDQGMLPNVFPEVGEQPEYNTVDAILWYFEAVRAYYSATQDRDLIQQIFPALVEVIEWHQRGTRYGIHLEADGLLYAGEPGVQLTWMDAKVGDWVITPRIGKPIEINALWYNALRTMVSLAGELNLPAQDFNRLAEKAIAGFQRYWLEEKGYCADVLDGPDGNDEALRPNQIFAVMLPDLSCPWAALLEKAQQKSVVDTCSRALVTSYGLRSLAPDHPDYVGTYSGDQLQRDQAYHQGTVWGWLIGPFIQAHLRAYGDPTQAQSFLMPMVNHLQTHGVGSLSEIFEGDAPFYPRGCVAQAWSVAEVLRTWRMIQEYDVPNA